MHDFYTIDAKKINIFRALTEDRKIANAASADEIHTKKDTARRSYCFHVFFKFIQYILLFASIFIYYGIVFSEKKKRQRLYGILPSYCTRLVYGASSGI